MRIIICLRVNILADVEFICEECPYCGLTHRIFISEDKLPCEGVSVAKDELHLSVESDSITLSDTPAGDNNG